MKKFIVGLAFFAIGVWLVEFLIQQFMNSSVIASLLDGDKSARWYLVFCHLLPSILPAVLAGGGADQDKDGLAVVYGLLGMVGAVILAALNFLVITIVYGVFSTTGAVSTIVLLFALLGGTAPVTVFIIELID